MINFTPRLDRAIKTASWAHERQGQHRKGTDIPYIIHPFGVMLIASQATDDEDILIACLFHDILEDVDDNIYNRKLMLSEYGERVTNIVNGVTHDVLIHDWRTRSEAYLEHLENFASDESIIVSAADKIHNLLSTIEDYKQQGDKIWQLFSTKNRDDQLWWYNSILDVLTKRQAPTDLINRLAEMISWLEKN